MRVCHGFTAVFDDPNLVSCAGLAPVLQLGERAGLQELVAEHVRIGKPGGGNAHLKVPALVAGMIAGADSVDDMCLLRHGAMGRLFTGVRAPSTLGTFLRTFTFGHVRQLDAVASRLLINVNNGMDVEWIGMYSSNYIWGTNTGRLVSDGSVTSVPAGVSVCHSGASTNEQCGTTAMPNTCWYANDVNLMFCHQTEVATTSPATLVAGGDSGGPYFLSYGSTFSAVGIQSGGVGNYTNCITQTGTQRCYHAGTFTDFDAIFNATNWWPNY